MKKSLLTIIILASTISIYSQSYRLGIGLDILTGNKYIDWQVGPSLVLKYSFEDIPVSVQGSTRFYLAQINSRYLSNEYTSTDLSLGISINYYPIRWAIEPFIGAGLFYNSNSITVSGTPGSFAPIITYPGDIKNNISEEITLGIDFSARSPINFVVEVTQTFNKPGKIITKDGAKIIKSENLNFNSLFLKLGVSFSI